MFVKSTVSKLSRIVPAPLLNEIFVQSDQSDFDTEGWFDVNHAIERTLISVGLTPADLALYNVIEEDTLISLDTTTLTTQPNVPNIFNAGQVIPDANKIDIEKIAIRFEIREVIDKAANNFGVIGGDGKTLNSIVINNNTIYKKLAIKELEDSTLCSPISGIIHLKYTLYHPYLSTCSLRIKKNSETTETPINDGIIDNPAVVDQRTNASSEINNPPTMERCTYIVRLYSSTRKHNGDYGDSDGSWPEEQLFFYNG